MAQATNEVLHEGDDAPDFFMTGEDREWIANTTEYMESNFNVSGAFADRDFIGGPPILDQINEFVYTCKKTVIEFHGGSEWRNYAARMVIQRMFVESQEESKHRLIVVVRDEEAGSKVPPFLACHFRLKSSEPDFHWKLHNSIRGLSLSNRKRLEKQAENMQTVEDPFTIPGNNLHDEKFPSSEPGSKSVTQEIRKDHDRFIPESHSHDPLEQELGNMAQQFSNGSPGSTSGDREGEQPRDRFLSEDIEGILSPIQSENLDGRARNSETLHEGLADKTEDGQMAADADKVSRSEQITTETRQADSEQKKLKDDKQNDNDNQHGKCDTSTKDVSSTDTVPSSNGLASIDLLSECSDTESAQMAGLSLGNQVNDSQSNSAKVHGETLLRKLEDYEGKLDAVSAADLRTVSMSPNEFREHQKSMSNLGRDGQDLICHILKTCATTVGGLQLDSAVEHDMSHFREYLLKEKYISPSLDQKLKKLKFEGTANSTMSENVIQVSNNVVARLCISDLKKLIQKAFETSS